MSAEAQLHLVQGYVHARRSDLFVFGGASDETSAARVVEKLSRRESRKPNASLFLTTNGGDPHAAFRMAKALQRFYRKTRLLIVGPCKSAGTLMALGAHEVAFAPTGELGPLDVQLNKPD